MVLLRRHRLATLTEGGWSTILSRPWDIQARECLAHWAAHRLPLVVTRQAAAAAGCIALGLPAPTRWGRRRLAVQVPRAALRGLGEFPHLGEVLPLLPAAAQGPVRDLMRELDRCRATARIFGSYGWQAISGCDHLRPDSDLDLALTVEGAAHADAVAGMLQGFRAAGPRLDGELVFGDGAAVAWREWSAWRAGRTQTVLVKRLDSVRLQRDAGWCEPAAPAELPS